MATLVDSDLISSKPADSASSVIYDSADSDPTSTVISDSADCDPASSVISDSAYSDQASSVTSDSADPASSVISDSADSAPNTHSVDSDPESLPSEPLIEFETTRGGKGVLMAHQRFHFMHKLMNGEVQYGTRYRCRSTTTCPARLSTDMNRVCISLDGVHDHSHREPSIHSVATNIQTYTTQQKTTVLRDHNNYSFYFKEMNAEKKRNYMAM